MWRAAGVWWVGLALLGLGAVPQSQGPAPNVAVGTPTFLSDGTEVGTTISSRLDVPGRTATLHPKSMPADCIAPAGGAVKPPVVEWLLEMTLLKAEGDILAVSVKWQRLQVRGLPSGDADGHSAALSLSPGSTVLLDYVADIRCGHLGVALRVGAFTSQDKVLETDATLVRVVDGIEHAIQSQSARVRLGRDVELLFDRASLGNSPADPGAYIAALVKPVALEGAKVSTLVTLSRTNILPSGVFESGGSLGFAVRSLSKEPDFFDVPTASSDGDSRFAVRVAMRVR